MTDDEIAALVMDGSISKILKMTNTSKPLKPLRTHIHTHISAKTHFGSLLASKIMFSANFSSKNTSGVP